MGRKAFKPYPQNHPEDQAGLGRGPGRHLASSKASSRVGHLPCSLPPWWLPVLIHSFSPPPTSQFSALCCFPCPPTPRSLQTSPSRLPVSPAHSPGSLPSLTCSGWAARFRSVFSTRTCALCLGCSSLPCVSLSHFPSLAQSLLLLAPPFVLVDTDFSQFPYFLLLFLPSLAVPLHSPH